MKIIINNINIYHIHDNRFYNNGNNNHLNVDLIKAQANDPTDLASCIIVNDAFENKDSPLITQLKARILKSECEVKKLLDQLNNENK